VVHADDLIAVTSGTGNAATAVGVAQ
jgi:hypothetical protein